ncbi:MAG TPA: RNA polymerase factor sigma-54 [Bacillales bacterium]|nr:RNA polymerase factor sigma-54 [Bacillales bacterium]
MKLGLFQQQTTKLVMTQELKQAISLLKYSQQELIEFIREQEMENPLIDFQESSIQDIRVPPSQPSQTKTSSLDWIKDDRAGMKDDLLHQARCLKIHPDRLEPLFYLIDLLDDDGYLPESAVTNMVGHLRLPESEAESALSVLQQLEPAGIGARSLQECLYLQMLRKDPDNELALNIIQYDLETFAEKKWQELAGKYRKPVDAVQKVAAVIQSLQPKPGSLFQKEKPQYVQPDLTVLHDNGRYTVKMHGDLAPLIRLNQSYHSFMKGNLEQDAFEYVQQKYRRFLWLQKSIEQRKVTLMRVTECIFRKQHRFLEKGMLALVPMTLRDVAYDLDIHESTVSRAVRNKWVQTPHGLRELKAFFSSKVSAGLGEETSSTKVKILLKTMISEEDGKRPYSDQQLASRLQDRHGIRLSRRTVAKYREQLHIPSSTKRKSYRV